MAEGYKFVNSAVFDLDKQFDTSNVKKYNKAKVYYKSTSKVMQVNNFEYPSFV